MFSLSGPAGVKPDGNRRWARRRDLDVIEGHKKGKEVLEDALKYFMDKGVKEVSVYTLSNDNLLKRKEIKKLLEFEHNVFKEILDSDFIHDNEVRIRFVGLWDKVQKPSLVNTIRSLIEETKKYSKNSLNIVFNYVTSKIVPRQLRQQKKLSDIDLLVRTGDRSSASGFLMQKLAYAEIYSSRKLWPDCDSNDFYYWLRWFGKQRRKFGS